MSFIDNVKKTVGQVGDVIKETYGPLSPLDSGPNTNTIWRYPLDVGNSQRYPHTVEFQTWIPDQISIADLGIGNSGATVGGVFGSALDLGKSVAKKLPGGLGESFTDSSGLEEINVTARRMVDPTEPQMKVNQNQMYNDRASDWTRRATPSDLIAMYMPAGGWMDRISNQYAQQSMTSAMGTAGFVLEAGSGLLDAYRDSGGKIPWGKAMDMIKGPEGMEIIGKMSSMAGMDAGIMTDAGLNALGYALNPQFEMLYSGTDLREFQFEFTMTPRSQKEAETIRMIIKKFKYHASPAYVSGQGRYIVPPSYFDITFNFNGARSRWLPQISTCVLKSFDVDYTGGLDQWSTHADGSPIQVKMVMVFAELEMMHKTLRRKGY